MSETTPARPPEPGPAPGADISVPGADGVESALSGAELTSRMGMLGLASFAAPLAGLLAIPLLAVALGVDGRGALAAGTAPLLFASVAFTFGMPEALIYFVAKVPSWRRSVLGRSRSVLVAGGLVATGGLILIAPLVAPDSSLIQRLIHLSAAALVPALYVLLLRADAAARGQWRRVALEQVVVAFSRLGVLLVLYLLHALTPLSATVAVAVSPVLGGLAYVRPTRVTRPASGLIPPRTVELLGYGGRIWIGSLSGVLLARLDQLVMTPLSSTRELGLYAAAANVSEVAIVVSNAVRDVTFATDAGDRSDHRLTTTGRLAWAVSMLLAVAIAVPAFWWMPIVFSAQFKDAVPSAVVMVLGLAMTVPGSIAGAGLSSRGRPGLRSLALTIASLVSIVLLVALVPVLGAMGAAITTVASSLVASGLNLYFLRRVSGVSPLHMYGLRRDDVAMIRTGLLQRRRELTGRG